MSQTKVKTTDGDIILLDATALSPGRQTHAIKISTASLRRMTYMNTAADVVQCAGVGLVGAFLLGRTASLLGRGGIKISGRWCIGGLSAIWFSTYWMSRQYLWIDDTGPAPVVSAKFDTNVIVKTSDKDLAVFHLRGLFGREYISIISVVRVMYRFMLGY